MAILAHTDSLRDSYTAGNLRLLFTFLADHFNPYWFIEKELYEMVAVVNSGAFHKHPLRFKGLPEEYNGVITHIK